MPPAPQPSAPPPPQPAAPLDNLEGLQSFILQHCAAPYECGVGGGAPDGSAPPPRVAVDIDLMLMADEWPEGLALLAARPLAEVLALVKPMVAALLGVTANLSLRPTHVPPMLHVPLQVATRAGASGGGGGGQLTSQQRPTVVLTGTIVRIYGKRVVPRSTTLHCPSCRAEVTVLSDPYDRGAVVKHTCDGGPRGAAKCKGTELLVSHTEWMDYTECRLQPRMVGAEGRLPRSVTVTLDDELATKCAAGQLVEVIGSAKARWRQTVARAVPQIETVVWAHNISSREEAGGASAVGSAAAGGAEASETSRAMDALGSPLEFARQYEGRPSLLRTLLLLSVCPHLSGLAGPRLGVLLSAVGGAEVKDERTGHRVRGSVHCLLVGDPSTGKSQLLRFAAQLAPRSVVTTGFTSSTAGLTAAATKEFGEWALEPGALVLSDGGTCVIDELRTVSSSDRTALHEAMEQQTISVAKAGLVTRLRTECTVVAACNPPMKRGSLASKGLSAELGIGGPLLSRFDFIFLLWDACSDRTDEAVASHIVQVTSADFAPPLAVDQLCRYLAAVKGRYVAAGGGPLLSRAAADLISRYYHHKRTRCPSLSACDDVPITIRFLEALVRVAQSHAKLLLKAHADLTDAAMAIFVMERTAHTTQTALFSDGSGAAIRTGAAELEACFLATDAASVEMQDRILDRIAELFGKVAMDGESAAFVSQHTVTGRDIRLGDDDDGNSDGQHPYAYSSSSGGADGGGGGGIGSKRPRSESYAPQQSMAPIDDLCGVGGGGGWSAAVYSHTPARSLTAHRPSPSMPGANPFGGM